MYFAFKTYPGGGAFALFFHPHPREFATQNKKSANARGLARGGMGAAGIDWCINIYLATLKTGRYKFRVPCAKFPNDLLHYKSWFSSSFAFHGVFFVGYPSYLLGYLLNRRQDRSR